MTGFLGEIGKKLADRWAALLAVPGLLYLAAVTAAAVLGQAHALSYPDLSRKIAAWAASPALKSVGGTVLIVAAILAGSVIGGPGSCGRRQVHRDPVDAARRNAFPPGGSPTGGGTAPGKPRPSRTPPLIRPQVDKAIARADRICLIEADRPTWIGDRLRACRVRIERAYGLDLNAAWPRLWLIVPGYRPHRTRRGPRRVQRRRPAHRVGHLVPDPRHLVVARHPSSP